MLAKMLDRGPVSISGVTVKFWCRNEENTLRNDRQKQAHHHCLINLGKSVSRHILRICRNSIGAPTFAMRHDESYPQAILKISIEIQRPFFASIVC